MGNYILAIGGLIIFSIFSLITNSSIVNNKNLSMESEFVITAASLAQSVIEEAKSKSFDQQTVIDTVTVLESLSSVSGVEGLEGSQVSLPDIMSDNKFKSASFYNDVDDYNGYKRVIDLPNSCPYTISVQVNYVSSTPPYTTNVINRTWLKKMTVIVESPFITIPVVYDYVFSYH